MKLTMGDEFELGAGSVCPVTVQAAQRMVELTALSFRSTKDPRLMTNIQKKYMVACCTIVRRMLG